MRVAKSGPPDKLGVMELHELIGETLRHRSDGIRYALSRSLAERFSPKAVIDTDSVYFDVYRFAFAHDVLD
jgi:hypothetical protein